MAPGKAAAAPRRWPLLQTLAVGLAGVLALVFAASTLAGLPGPAPGTGAAAAAAEGPIVEADPTAAVQLAVVTDYASPETLARSGPGVRGTHARYAQRHGYALIDARDLPAVRAAAAALPPAQAPFLRYWAVFRALEHYDAVLWIDPDLVFLNLSAPLDDLLAPPAFDVVAPAGAPAAGPAAAHLFGTHAFLARRTPRALELLQALWAMRKVDCRADAAAATLLLAPGLTACGADGGWWRGDAGAFNWLVRSRPQTVGCRVRAVPVRELGAPVPYYGDGDRLLRLPGTLDEQQREVLDAIFRDWAAAPTPDPLFAGIVDPEAGTINVQRAPFLQAEASAAYPRGADAWAAYAPWNRPCDAT